MAVQYCIVELDFDRGAGDHVTRQEGANAGFRDVCNSSLEGFGEIVEVCHPDPEVGGKSWFFAALHKGVIG